MFTKTTKTSFWRNNIISCCFLSLFFLSTSSLNAQTGDCPYPIIFLHGWTGDQTSFIDTYSDTEFENLWGGLTDVFWSMQNASFSTNIWGNDGIPNTPDDDVLTWFTNETNKLDPGCIYAINMDNSWNEDPANPVILKNDGSAIGFTESDSNESAIFKAGQMLKRCIEEVLFANPGKDKVILVGHSMGGLAIREYLQRRDPPTPTGTPLWWQDPSSPDGHKVARAMTCVTPHGGSNTMGNISDAKNEEEVASRDGLPDLNSEAVRDLRYSWSCGFLGLDNCRASYLYGGDEDAGWGWWNEDVDCDGNESDDNVVGINISGTAQGFGQVWHGTYDNPDIPLPQNVHYTWLTSDIFGDDGDGVVHWTRQWLYDGNTPLPSDGVAGRVSDTLLIYRFHTSANDYATEVIRGIDEPDYPFYAYQVELDKTYANALTRRASNVAEGSPSTDVDFFKINIPEDHLGGLNIEIGTHIEKDITVTYFQTAPEDFLNFADNGDIQQVFTANSGNQTLNISGNMVTPGETIFLKIQADNVDFNDWKNPVTFMLSAAPPLAIELADFWGQSHEKSIELQWQMAGNLTMEHFMVERSHNGFNFSEIGIVAANNDRQFNYVFIDEKPLKGDNYYRLKSVEADGKIEFSESLYFEFKPAFSFVKRVYPVPASHFAIVEIEMTKSQDLEYFLSNAMGSIIQQNNQRMEEGEQQLYLELNDLPSGIYFVKIMGENLQEEVRLLKR